ncbi:MAG: ribonuclease III [Rhodospirillales bacterium]
MSPITSQALSGRLDYQFRDGRLLDEALTHRSAIDRRAGKSNFAYGNERLEFLGDRVLALVVAEMLQEVFPNEDEGALAKRHAALVREEMLAEIAAELELGEALKISDSERASGGAAKPSILADACEALLGAIYRDGGLDPVAVIIRRYWMKHLEAERRPPADAKTMLQEWAQSRGLPLPYYRELGRDGPDHAPLFAIEVSVKDRAPASGEGRTKREAERVAAEKLLAELDP